MSVKILLVEDDPNLGFVIKDNLAIKGYEVTLSENGDDRLHLSTKKNSTCVFWM